MTKPRRRAGSLTAVKLFGCPWGRKMERPESRELVALALLHSNNRVMRQLGELSLDPSRRDTSMATIAEQLHLGYWEIAEEFKRLQRQEGTIRMYAHIPDLMEQAAIEAKTREVACRRCRSTGQVQARDDRKRLRTDDQGQPVMEECPVCFGHGQVLKQGDIDNLKLVFESAEITGHNRGLGPLVNLNINQAGTHERLEDLAASVSQIIDVPKALVADAPGVEHEPDAPHENGVGDGSGDEGAQP